MSSPNPECLKESEKLWLETLIKRLGRIPDLLNDIRGKSLDEIRSNRELMEKFKTAGINFNFLIDLLTKF